MTRVDSRPPDCIDGETLAAWSSGSLRPANAAAVEEHLSNCERCQAMLATFVRIEPPPALVHSVWRRWHLQWLVPLATAATVAAVWVAIPQESQQDLTAPVESVFAPANLPAPAPQRSTVPAVPEAGQRDDKFESAAKQVKSEAKEQERQQKVGNEVRRRAEPEADRKAADSLGAVVGTPASPPASPRALEERAAAPPPPAAAAPQASRETSALMRRSQLADEESTRIVSSTSTHQWRIIGGRQVDHSSTGGKQWERVLTSGSDRLTAGHSPSPTVVWLVGRAGAVYVTSDGAKFEKVPFIEPIDLVSVVAIDNRQATVATADGRAFQTMDRGLTWMRVP